MEPNPLPIRRSTKTVIELRELYSNKIFNFPDSFANDRDPMSGVPSIMVAINGRKQFIPVGRDTEVDYEAFCLLRDCGIISPNQTFEVGGEFDPFKQW